ncbi:hypothetical protein MnTg02_00840 [bacterium MnTg02]|nr:hypothetical protein MnTg02_00840 [bacterium MnTg02]
MRLGIDNRVGNLTGLPGDQQPPYGVALRPNIFSLVVKPLAVLVHDNRINNAVDPRANPAIIFWRPPIDGDGVALIGFAHLARAIIEKHPQHPAHIVTRAANEEIIRNVSPSLFEPREIRFKAARGDDHRLRLDLFHLPVARNFGRRKLSIFKNQIGYFGLIEDFDAQGFSGGEIGIHHGLAAAEEKCVCAAEAECPAEGGLEAHTLRHHPIHRMRGAFDHQARQFLIGFAAGHAQQIVPIFLF